ncbi:hypothetical protein AFGD_008280 [Aspergillus flavus]|nr:hypothetical protein AFGD_008280 [Aspergillus flavus]
MAKVLGLASPFKTPIKAKKPLDRVNAVPEVPDSASSGGVTGTRDVSNSSKAPPSGISAIRPLRSEEKFRTPERQCEAFYAQEKPEMSGARCGDCSDPMPICQTVRSEETSPLVRKSLRQRKLPDRGLVSKVKRKLQFSVSPSKRRFLASKKTVRRKSSTTRTTNWWNISTGMSGS